MHPNDHVNMGQSSNDMIPTAIHLSAMMEFRQHLCPALQELEEALRAKSGEFWPVIETGADSPAGCHTDPPGTGVSRIRGPGEAVGREVCR